MSKTHGPPAPGIIIPTLSLLGYTLIRIARKIGAWS